MRSFLVAAIAVLSVSATPVVAQLSAGFSAASFQFNLSNPGARSLGMGGAFVGLADDATAAYANPAGLTIVVRPEVSFEGRSATFRLPLVAAEPIVNLATLSNQDLTGETIFETAAMSGVAELTPLGAPDATGTTASFVSYVYPAKRWTFALYRHQLADLEAADGAVLPAITTAALENLVTTSGSTDARAKVDISGLGFAVARQLGEHFAAGLTFVRSEAAIHADRTSSFRERFEGRFSGETAVAFENVLDGESTNFTINAGVLARPNERTAIGASWRPGPRFSLNESNTTRMSFGQVTSPGLHREFRVPDVLSLGASFQATRQAVIAVEWDRVKYSELSRPIELPDSLANFGIGGTGGSVFGLGRFDVADADEFRAGFEYTFWKSSLTPSVRLGMWFDPEHKIEFESGARCPGSTLREGQVFRCLVERTSANGALPPGTIAALAAEVSAATAAEALALLFPRGEDELHVTGGFGLAVASRFQFDTAFDYVDSDQFVISLSGIVQF